MVRSLARQLTTVLTDVRRGWWSRGGGVQVVRVYSLSVETMGTAYNLFVCVRGGGVCLNVGDNGESSGRTRRALTEGWVASPSSCYRIATCR